MFRHISALDHAHDGIPVWRYPAAHGHASVDQSLSPRGSRIWFRRVAVGENVSRLAKSISASPAQCVRQCHLRFGAHEARAGTTWERMFGSAGCWPCGQHGPEDAATIRADHHRRGRGAADDQGNPSGIGPGESGPRQVQRVQPGYRGGGQPSPTQAHAAATDANTQVTTPRTSDRSGCCFVLDGSGQGGLARTRRPVEEDHPAGTVTASHPATVSGARQRGQVAAVSRRSVTLIVTMILF
jgi:hypothetical protein